MLTETGAILHIPSGKCVAPIAAVNNGVIKLQSACNSANSWFQHTSAKTIRHMRTGFCIHPYLGSSSPTIGTKLVIYVGCIEARLQFNFIYGLLLHMDSARQSKPYNHNNGQALIHSKLICNNKMASVSELHCLQLKC